MLFQLKTLISKEFYAYFNNISAYIVVGAYIILTLGSAFYIGDFFQIDNSSLISLFSPQPEILSLLIPAICMPLWSDEYRTGTIEFLLTQPIEYSILIMGKYLASSGIGIMLLCLTLPLTLTTGLYTGLNTSTVICGYTGVILTILTYTAICNLTSLISPRPIIAYLSGFLIIRLLMAIKFEPSSGLNFEQHYQNIITGRISLASIIYFLSLIIFILWACTAYLSSQKKN